MKTEITIEQSDFELKNFRKGFFSGKKCYDCIFKGNVPGSTHSSCNAKGALINAEEHGIKSGWVIFPINFDPIWITSCDSFLSKNYKEELQDKEHSQLIKEYIIEIKYIQDKFVYLKTNNQLTQGIIDKMKAINATFDELPEGANIDNVSKEQLVQLIYKIRRS